jgi:hypothetical protein
MMGLPVRVIATSESARRCSAPWAIFWADRTAVGRKAIFSTGRVQEMPLAWSIAIALGKKFRRSVPAM